MRHATASLVDDANQLETLLISMDRRQHNEFSQACVRGYLSVATLSDHSGLTFRLVIAYWLWCRLNQRPFIEVADADGQAAQIVLSLATLDHAFEVESHIDFRSRFALCARPGTFFADSYGRYIAVVNQNCVPEIARTLRNLAREQDVRPGLELVLHQSDPQRHVLAE